MQILYLRVPLLSLTDHWLKVQLVHHYTYFQVHHLTSAVAASSQTAVGASCMQYTLMRGRCLLGSNCYMQVAMLR